MVDEAAGGVAPRPWLDRRGLQIGDVVTLNQRHTLAGDPLLVHGFASALLRRYVKHKLPPPLSDSRGHAAADNRAHPRGDTVGGALALIQLEDLWILVFVLDLVATIFDRLVHVLVELLTGTRDEVPGAAKDQCHVAAVHGPGV